MDTNLIAVDDANDSCNDLSDGEWEHTKKLFRRLRDEKYKTVWESIASRDRASHVLRDETNRVVPVATTTSARQRHATSSCQDGCCNVNPNAFLPTTSDLASRRNDELTEGLARLDWDASADHCYPTADNNQDLGSSPNGEANGYFEQDDGSKSTIGYNGESDLDESSDESVGKSDQVSFTDSTPEPERGARRGTAPRSSFATSSPRTSPAIQNDKGASSSETDANRFEVIEISSDEDDDDFAAPAETTRGTSTFTRLLQSKTLPKSQLLIKERLAPIDKRRMHSLAPGSDSSEKSDDEETDGMWLSPPNCTSPRFASNHDEPNNEVDESDEEGDGISSYNERPAGFSDDASSASSVENSWDGKLSDESESESSVEVPAETEFIVLDSDSDDELMLVTQPVDQPIRSRETKSQSSRSKTTFAKIREQLA
ncbi:hypothetical protein MPSEU_000697900 [Mayamaea pseudoterrestris]|nr:hypothetical protein MPSEU_000697900 [Mayamaea pseudoterrestris]